MECVKGDSNPSGLKSDDSDVANQADSTTITITPTSSMYNKDTPGLTTAATDLPEKPAPEPEPPCFSDYFHMGMIASGLGGLIGGVVFLVLPFANPHAMDVTY